MNLKTCWMFGLFISFMMACKPNNCIYYQTAMVNEIVAPDSGKVNSQIPVNIYFPIHDGCGTVNSYSVVKSANLFTFNGVIKYEGCECVQNAYKVYAPFNFIPKDTGFYLFKFYTNSTKYSFDTIYIVE